MHIFVYEFVTGGGFLGTDSLPPSSLLAEGQAMVSALVDGLSQIEGCTVSAMWDRRLLALDLPIGNVPPCHSGLAVTLGTPQRAFPTEFYEVSNAENERAIFRRLAAEADWTVVIAPEFDGHLHTRTVWVRDVGGRLLGPGPDLVALTADKQRTGQHLAAAVVPVPASRLVVEHEPLPVDFPYPAVLKPVDGAGSQGAGSQNVELIHSAAEAISPSDQPRLLERFCPGTAASVAVLCGPGGHVILPACRQHLSEDGRFRYLGGSLPLEPALAERARSLATRAIDSLHDPFGYIGIDLILGEAEGGNHDVVIEINSRLTTSYVGLRMAANENLAAAMLDVAVGRQISLSFRDKPLQFDATGVSVTGSQAPLGG